MWHRKSTEIAGDTKHMKRKRGNRPMANVALAGLLGAGVMALMSSRKRSAERK